ncbi:MAG: hypothetical protein GXX84_00110 [Acidobacteria bacterium]|nr:hypothetical protein [Acidobacteriota bacterium]
MSKISCLVSAVVLCLFAGVSWNGGSFAKDEVTPQDVVAGHLRSVGTPEAIAAVKTLAFVGTTSVEFIQGMHGNMTGQSMCIADGNKLGIVLKYGDINYPGEYLAYDGKEVSVGNISPGQRSPLADFVFRYNGIMKEGLLGGVLSGGWPLLHLKETQAELKYRKARIDGRQVHEIEYRPKQIIRDMKIRLYFDAETNRHVKTEYRVRIRDDMSAAPGGGATRTGRFQAPGQSSGDFDALSGGLPDSIYVLVEQFDDFRKVGELTLPHSYTIDYSVEGQGHSFIAKWTAKAIQWAFNNAYDEKLFVAEK